MKNQSFLKWLRSTEEKKPKFVSGTTFLSGIFTIFVFLYSRMPAFSVDGLRRALASSDAHLFMGTLLALHAATCVVLVWASPRPLSASTQSGASITHEAYARIQMMVLYLYSSLALLYTVYAFFTYKYLKQPMQAWSQVFETLTATLIFFLYVEMSEVTVTGDEQIESQVGQITKVFRLNDTYRHKISFSVLAAILIIISILSFFYPSDTPQSQDVQWFIRLIVSCLSSVTLGLVIGRLGSLYINPGTVILSLLYLYASIQPFAASFNQEIVLFVVTSLALPLKILLWLVFIWAFTTGKLWEYVQEARDILERRDENRQID